MADIFISYKKEESEFARQFARAFEAEGWTVWWDAQIQAGDDFDETIREELDKARIVVVLWSQQSIESDYIKGEARSSKDQDKLISVFIDDVTESELPFDLQAIQGERIQDPTDQAELRKLLNDITARIGPAKSKRERELEAKLSEALNELNVQKQSASKPGSRELFPWALSLVLAVIAGYVWISGTTTDSTETELRAELEKWQQEFAKAEERSSYDRSQLENMKQQVAVLEAVENKNEQLAEEANRWQASANEAEQKNREDAQIIQELTEKASEAEHLRTANEELMAEVENWKSGVYSTDSQEGLVSADTLARKEAELEGVKQAHSMLAAELKELRVIADQSAAQIQSDHQTISRLQSMVSEADGLRQANETLMAELDKWKSGVYTSPDVSQENLVSIETLNRKEAELQELRAVGAAQELKVDRWRTRAELTAKKNRKYQSDIADLEAQLAQVSSLKNANEQLNVELAKWRKGEYRVAGQTAGADSISAEQLEQKETELADARKTNTELETQIVELRTTVENSTAKNQSDRRTIANLNARVTELTQANQASLARIDKLRAQIAAATPPEAEHVLIGVWKGEAVVGLNQTMSTRLEIQELDSGVLTGRISITGGENSCRRSSAKLTPGTGRTYSVTFSGGCNARGEFRHNNDSLAGNVSFFITNDTARVNLKRAE